jgi:branched-chain amino acid transport system substrate-binding protein
MSRPPSGGRRASARRTIPLLLALAVTAAACGQKSGVAGTGDNGSGSATTAGSTRPPITAAPVAPTTSPGATTTAGATTAPGATTTAPGAPTTVAETTTAPAPSGPFEPGGNDTAGVSDTEIVIGIHAPVTGASPIPQTSFDIGKDIYWKFLAESAPDELFGRKVRVVFRDDTFNPQTAVQVCRQMVEDEGAFMLVGGGGADQITACAQYAADNGIPYLSAGVNEDGLADLETYFATTLTYAQQAPLLMRLLKEKGITDVGLVVADTPSFNDALAAIKVAAGEAGVNIVYETRINKAAAEPEQLSVIQALKDQGPAAVVLLASPVVFIGLANQGLNQGFTPLWLGPGVTSGLNAVTNFGCPAVETGEFLSPTPNLDVIDQLDPNFKTAYAQFAPADATADDIGLQLWSLNKALALMLEATGQELGRAAFMNTLVTAPGFDNGIYSPVQFTVDDHFGGTGADVLDANCATKTFDTAQQFLKVS